MNKEIEITDELIARYLAGEASPEEAIALHDWQRLPGNQLHFKKLQQTWHDAYPLQRPRAVDYKKAWDNMASKRENEKIFIKENSSSSTSNFFTSWMGIAASIVVVLGISMIFYVYDREEIAASIAINSMDTVRRVTLPDNSHVTMNRNSIFSYPENFEASQRTVHFNSGEAFFDVTRNESKPFVIQTHLASIKVIGTAFNVIVNQDLMEVSVDEGKVLVYTSNDSVYLEPGFTVRIRPGNSDLTPVTTSDRNIWAYATHKFVFQETPLYEVFKDIEKAQLCSIKLDNQAIGNCKLTATFESVSTDYILTLITEAMNLSVTKDGKTFTVEGEGCY